MKAISILPKDKNAWLEARQPNLNSTEISALFGINPYLTHFELWHQKKNNLAVEFEGNERTSWGTRLEESIAKGVAEDNGFKIRKMDEYLYDPQLRVGASFDYAIENDGLLEVKNVDALVFRDGWLMEEDHLEAPAHIEMQVQVQLALSNRAYNYIACLVGGNTVKLLKREPDNRVILSILKRAEAFWNSIELDEEPRPDFSRDAETIKALYSQAQSGKILDAKNDLEIQSLAEKYKDLTVRKKLVESELEEVKSRLLISAGDAEKVISDKFSISLGVVRGGPVSYDRQDYRMFKLNWKKDRSILCPK